MSDIDSSRVFEISELTPAAASLSGTDKTLVSRAGRSGPALLSDLYAWVKVQTDGVYVQPPSQLTAAALPLAGTEKALLSQGSNNVFLLLSDLYAWVKGQTDNVYVRPPSQLTAAALPLAGTEKALLSQGSNNVSLLLSDLYAWVKGQTDLLYSKLPDTSAKGGQVLVVAADGLSFVWSGSTPVPPTITTSTGAGSSTVKSVTGNARSGQIKVTTAGTPTAGGVVATVTFAAALPAAPRVFITPGNAATAALASGATVWASATSSTIVLTSNTTALPVAAYVWNYLIEL